MRVRVSIEVGHQSLIHAQWLGVCDEAELPKLITRTTAEALASVTPHRESARAQRIELRTVVLIGEVRP